MFLKSIEARGFKSFADKTEIILKNGITCIVGPNGSGKSNVSDAIRWVLGEQSVKSLRGGKMEDVIFAGTAYRKQLGLAQVSLSLDNSDGALPIDYNTVTISRRLYRSGESEYYLNNTKCRLRDIHELFMDTGIGKEGYSIIGQGKIESLLSGNNDERRALLEEAAGIVKYKSRKVEAEKRLDSAENNIVRINDILGTYEERLEPLRLDSEKTKKFLDYSNQLKSNEITLTVRSLDGYDERVSKLKEELDLKASDYDKKALYREEKKAEIETIEKELSDVEESFEQERKSYFEKREEIQNVENRSVLSKERIKLLEDNIEKEKVFLNEVKNKEAEIEIKILETNKEIEKFELEYKDITTRLGSMDENDKNQRMSLKAKEERISELKLLKEELLENMRNIFSKKEILANNYENLKVKQENLMALSQGYSNTVMINNSTKLSLNEDAKRVSQNIASLNDDLASIKKKLSNLYRDKTIQGKKLREMEDQITKIESNRNALANLEDHYTGYSAAVKSLMTDIKNNRVQGFKEEAFVLGEIINVRKEYEKAIEISLGFAISNVITDTDSASKILISHLRNRNLGRATFLPLNIISDRVLTVNDNIKCLDGYIGVASELVDRDKRFDKAIKYSLGRTVIATDLDSALIIAKKGSYSFRIVTLSGEVINAGGSLTGGSSNNKSSNIVGRKREIEELKQSGEKLAKEVEEFKTVIKKIDDQIVIFDEEALNLTDKIHGENIEVTKIREKINALDKENNNLNIQIRESKSEEENIRLALEAIASEKEDTNAKRSNLENEQLKLTEDINAATKEYESYKRMIEETGDETTALKIEEARKKGIIDNLKKDNIRLLEEAEGSKLSSERSIRAIDDSLKNIEDSKLELESNDKNTEALRNVVSELEEKFKDKEAQRIGLKEKINKLSTLVDDMEISINQAQNDHHKIEILYTKLSSEYENLLKKLNEEYKITLAEAKEVPKVEGTMEELKGRITDLKIKINSLGTVNALAIDEYKETLEKYEEMNMQRNDLIASKEELLKVINDMTGTMKEVFEENFNKLRVYYNETFKELFKGGHADLVLAGDDILNAPIEINVQPPGKKLQNINLMSGGEKGLSAIALLFAILKMKPTPFCILDEIEAALDDANVNRYAEFLKLFSKETQFIVITHRKGTMEAADILYGITMEEKGVSKIVSVDLRDI